MFDIFYQNLLNTSWLEIIAVIFGLLSVWFCRKENILVYPTGIVNVLIFVYIFFSAKLYANMGINFFYFVMSIYGWYMWTHKGKNDEKTLTVTKCSRNEYIIDISAFIFFFIILRYVLNKYTDSNYPLWDSFTTSIFFIAMWMQARKKLESWILWIIGDTLIIPLCFINNLVFTSFQYLVFLMLAISGLIEWNKSFIKSQKKQLEEQK